MTVRALSQRAAAAAAALTGCLVPSYRIPSGESLAGESLAGDSLGTCESKRHCVPTLSFPASASIPLHLPSALGSRGSPLTILHITWKGAARAGQLTLVIWRTRMD